MQNISTLQNPVAYQEQDCPDCGTLLPVYRGFLTWCHECNWNVKPSVAKKPKNIFEIFYNNMGQRLSSSLFNELANSETYKPRFSKGKILAYLVASLVHAFTLGLFVLGIFMVVRSWPALLVVLIGIFQIMLAWYVRPKLPKMRTTGGITRQSNPAIYDMVDKVCQALDTSKVEAIFINESFNAAVTQVGWRRRKVLIIGLPLFSILIDEERLAVLGHEMGHFVNGDPTRTIFIGTALDSLVTWYPLLLPASSTVYKPGLLVLLTRPILNLFLRLLAGIVRLLVKVLSNLNWRDSQRAEYLADSLAARIGGRDAMISMLEKLHYHDYFELVVQRVALNKAKPDLFAEYFNYLAEVPERELERIRRVEQLSDSRLDSTHPPTGYRVDVLKRKPVSTPKVIWSPVQASQLESELKRFQKPVQEKLIDKLHATLY